MIDPGTVSAGLERWVSWRHLVVPASLIAAICAVATTLPSIEGPFQVVQKVCGLLQVDDSWLRIAQAWLHSRSSTMAPIFVVSTVALFMFSCYRYRAIPSRGFENHTYLTWLCCCAAIECGGRPAVLWMLIGMPGVYVILGIELIFQDRDGGPDVLVGLSFAAHGVISVVTLPFTCGAAFLIDTPRGGDSVENAPISMPTGSLNPAEMA